MQLDRDALDARLAATRERLLQGRAPAGHWEGELSSSALSTATGVFALATVDRRAHAARIARGLDWLGARQNPDGGWGDTVASLSNISTTMLCWAAFAAAPNAGERYHRAVAATEGWLAERAGSLEPAALAGALVRRYGEDRTFSAPILSMCALSGRLGPVEQAWRWVSPLPFELAACPHRWLRFFSLPVVSYALPALIAIGQARHHFQPSRNPAARCLRHLLRGRTLDVLQRIQPAGGGFLEAPPLTSFVVMCLASIGRRNHPVVARGAEFLTATVREDGSWPIDTNLATWVTTLSVNALSIGRTGPAGLAEADRRRIRDWLGAQQYRSEHVYTHARPGGWAWTDRAGGVPDADDTAGALLALRRLGPKDQTSIDAAAAGAAWLLDLQNRDGGIPTFCRGWGALPFDRSAPDLTAHALAAWAVWQDDLPPALRSRVTAAADRAVAYLARAQRPDGAWVPLWFGNQFQPSEENPTYGTARVLTALADRPRHSRGPLSPMLANGVRWLTSAQNDDGGWGGGPPASSPMPSSVEETALAVEALAAMARHPAAVEQVDSVTGALARGVRWLIERGETTPPAPIGFYFARLWYFERLYPVIFTAAALARAASVLGSPIDSRRNWGTLPGGAVEQGMDLDKTTAPRE